MVVCHNFYFLAVFKMTRCNFFFLLCIEYIIVKQAKVSIGNIVSIVLQYDQYYSTYSQLRLIIVQTTRSY